MESEKIIIIGSGPAGLTAAIYAARAGLDPMVISGQIPGGQLTTTKEVENWPGHIRILGPDLMDGLREHAIHYGARIIDDEIVKVELQSVPFTLNSHTNKTFKSETLIIATGSTPRKLNAEGEDEYWGKGVSTCSICDGPLFKNRRVIIVGGGDNATETAAFMSNYTDKITIIQKSSHLTATAIMQERILKNPKIKIIYDSTITKIIGADSRVTHAIVTNRKTGDKSELEVDGIFINIGVTPNTELFKEYLKRDKWGYLMLTNKTKTTVPGVFAAGDVADHEYRQAITAAGTGCMAAIDAERYLKSLKK